MLIVPFWLMALAEDRQAKMDAPVVRLHPLEGGLVPERMSERAIGFDGHARQIVSAFDMNPDHPNLRRTIFDFEAVPADATSQEQVELVNDPNNAANLVWAWRLDPRGRALVSIGFVTELPDAPVGYDWSYWIAPRSGLASKHGVTIGNTPGTVDADYRGEPAVVLMNLGEAPFYITQKSRICQIIFNIAPVPAFETVHDLDELTDTERGAGGFGSTGGYHTP